MIIAPLNQYPQYCSDIAYYLFEEWSDLYINYTSYKTKELYLNEYVLKNINSMFVGFDEDFIGCFSLNTLYFKLYLSDVYINPIYRNNGYGTKLINYAIQYVKSIKKQILYLLIDKDEMIKFYERFGFQLENYRDNFGRKRMYIKFYDTYNYIILLLIICVLLFLLL